MIVMAVAFVLRFGVQIEILREKVEMVCGSDLVELQALKEVSF